MELSVRENLIMYARYFDIPWAEGRRRADELLEFVQLVERAKDKVDDLSGGMKRRLTIARGLINQPDLLLLDEPTTGLDPQARHLVWDRLYRLKQRGVTLVLTTHYMDEAEQLCDRLVVMDKAKIAAEGTPRELIAKYSTKEVLELRFGADETAEHWMAGLTASPIASKCCPTASCSTRPTGRRRRPRCTAAGCGPRARWCAAARWRTSSCDSPAGALSIRCQLLERSASSSTTRWSSSGMWRGSIMVSFFTPLFFLASMGLGLGSLVNRGSGGVGGVPYIDYLAPGLLAATTMQAAAFLCTYPILGNIMWDRIYDAMLATPIAVRDVLIGEVTWIAIRMLLVAAIFWCVMAVFGVAHTAESLLAIAAATLTGLAFATPLMAFTSTQRDDNSFSVIFRFVITPLYLLGGAFFPIADAAGRAAGGGVGDPAGSWRRAVSRARAWEPVRERGGATHHRAARLTSSQESRSLDPFLPGG